MRTKEKGEMTNPFSEEGAGDDEGNIDRVAAHDDLVKAFQSASTPSSSCRFHSDSYISSKK